MDRGHPYGASMRHSHDFNADVWAHGDSRALGPPDAVVARDSIGHWRLHRVRAARLRSPEHAAIPPGTGAHWTDPRRTFESPRFGENPSRRVDQQHSSFVGKTEQT